MNDDLNLPVEKVMPDNSSINIEFPITGFVYDAKTDSTKIILAGSFFVVFPGKWNEDRVRKAMEEKYGRID